MFQDFIFRSHSLIFLNELNLLSVKLIEHFAYVSIPSPFWVINFQPSKFMFLKITSQIYTFPFLKCTDKVTMCLICSIYGCYGKRKNKNGGNLEHNSDLEASI